VVIASHDTRFVIDTCLGALEQQQGPHLEVIVADSSTDGTADRVAERYSWVRLIREAAGAPLQKLRGRGIAAARGSVIAILDPYSVAAPDWAERVIAAHASRPNMVIGGSVGLDRPETRSWTARAQYFNEYGLFMPPIRTGEGWIVPGSNVSYKREALFAGDTPRYPVFWKTFVNWDIERGGSPLWLSADIRIDLNKPIPFSDFLRTRYDHGRCFAGRRVDAASFANRTLRAASAGLIPFVLLARWTRGFWPKRRARGAFLATVPAQFLLFTVWAWGEACGYIAGSGRCCERLHY
jgi:glycosyltransferase involved in cell wall biosynthesis